DAGGLPMPDQLVLLELGPIGKEGPQLAVHLVTSFLSPRMALLGVRVCEDVHNSGPKKGSAEERQTNRLPHLHSTKGAGRRQRFPGGLQPRRRAPGRRRLPW